MENTIKPNPNTLFPVAGFKQITYIKPTINKPNIIVGDFSYFSGGDFQTRVTHHYDFYEDKLIIGKFCQIAADVHFIMNGANHQMNAVSTFPFYIFEGWQQKTPPMSYMPHKGDTLIGNDVWIGQNATILPGVRIGNGAIIGMNSVVGTDIPAYAVVVGNPARVIYKRFDDELIDLLQKFAWWDKPIDEINTLIPVLTSPDLVWVKNTIRDLIYPSNE